MPGARKLLDTSTLSEVIKQRDPHVRERTREYLDAHRRFTSSILTRYEILGGLKAKSAKAQLKRSRELSETSIKHVMSAGPGWRLT